MPAELLKQRWQNGEITFGCGMKLSSTWMAEALAVSGFDYVKFDLQHGIIPLHELMPMFQAMRGTDVTSLVKVPQNDPILIGQVLDMGAEGISVPDIETPDDAKAAVASLRFPPEGIRSNSTYRLKYLPNGISRETICIATIESALGAKNAEEIARVPGIDGIIIGPSDLAFSLGLPPVSGHSIRSGPHEEAITKIRNACKNAGIACGMTTDSSPAELVELGFQMISLGGDTSFFERGMKAALAEARQVASREH